jgi:hypothetical protein
MRLDLGTQRGGETLFRRLPIGRTGLDSWAERPIAVARIRASMWPWGSRGARARRANVEGETTADN